jgi:hypothetical protein
VRQKKVKTYHRFLEDWYNNKDSHYWEYWKNKYFPGKTDNYIHSYIINRINSDRYALSIFWNRWYRNKKKHRERIMFSSQLTRFLRNDDIEPQSFPVNKV